MIICRARPENRNLRHEFISFLKLGKKLAFTVAVASVLVFINSVPNFLYCNFRMRPLLCATELCISLKFENHGNKTGISDL